jgi:hypothetical protein
MPKNKKEVAKEVTKEENSLTTNSSKLEKIFTGKPPETIPPRTEDFDELSKKIIDSLIDSIKYIATTCGITIAIYAQILQGYVKLQSVSSNSLAKLLVFSPLLLWFLTILSTIIGIYPKGYKATTDLEKQNAINEIRKTKSFWLKVALFFFITGFGLFILVIAAQIGNFYPFNSD